jgi:hypothetical protein
VICPGCRCDNHGRRRYCGKCGCNFEPACRDCGFANDQADRFCGGCGVGLIAGARSGLAVLEGLPFAAPVPGTQPAPPPRVDELAGLFAAQPVREETPSQLPALGITQDDLDRLFGVAP